MQVVQRAICARIRTAARFGIRTFVAGDHGAGAQNQQQESSKDKRKQWTLNEKIAWYVAALSLGAVVAASARIDIREQKSICSAKREQPTCDNQYAFISAAFKAAPPTLVSITHTQPRHPPAPLLVPGFIRSLAEGARRRQHLRRCRPRAQESLRR